MAAARTRDDPAGDAIDRLAILQLEAEYARTWDSRDASGWAACFVADGAFEIASFATKPAVRFAGTSALTEFCRRATGRYEGIHVLAQPSLTLDSSETGDRPSGARGWVHFQYHDRDRKTEARRHVVGVYAVTYARAGDGTWRMQLRREQAFLENDVVGGFPDAARMWGPELR